MIFCRLLFGMCPLKLAFLSPFLLFHQLDNEAMLSNTRPRMPSAARADSGILRPRSLPQLSLQEAAAASGRRSPEVRDPGRSFAVDGSGEPDRQKDPRASSSDTSPRKPSTASRNNNAANRFLPTNGILPPGLAGLHHQQQLLLQQGAAAGIDNSFTPRGLPGWPAARTSAAMAAAVAAASGMGLPSFLPWSLPGMPFADPSGSSRDGTAPGAYPSPLQLLMASMAAQHHPQGHLSSLQGSGTGGQLFLDSPFNNCMPGSGMPGSDRGRHEGSGDGLARGMLEHQVGSSRANSPDDRVSARSLQCCVYLWYLCSCGSAVWYLCSCGSAVFTCVVVAVLCGTCVVVAVLCLLV
jgi:hypothetical protein